MKTLSSAWSKPCWSAGLPHGYAHRSPRRRNPWRHRRGGQLMTVSPSPARALSAWSFCMKIPAASVAWFMQCDCGKEKNGLTNTTSLKASPAAVAVLGRSNALSGKSRTYLANALANLLHCAKIQLGVPSKQFAGFVNVTAESFQLMSVKTSFQGMPQPVGIGVETI